MTNCMKCKFLKDLSKDDFLCEVRTISIPRELVFNDILNYFQICYYFQPL